MDVIDLRDFYASGLGDIARGFLVRNLHDQWPKLDGLSVIGLGYALPYLASWRDSGQLRAGLLPARLGVLRWPARGPQAVSLIDEADLPLPESCVDRVLVIHGLEMTDAPEDMLNEIWRVLKPGGQLLLVVPNRRGMWARSDATPFGHGRPFSRGQLMQYLRNAMFSPGGWSHALYLPPSRAAFFSRFAAIWERLGLWFWPGFAGVIIVEASKQVYAVAPGRAVRRGLRKFGPMLAPSPARFDT